MIDALSNNQTDTLLCELIACAKLFTEKCETEISTIRQGEFKDGSYYRLFVGRVIFDNYNIFIVELYDDKNERASNLIEKSLTDRLTRIYQKMLRIKWEKEIMIAFKDFARGVLNHKNQERYGGYCFQSDVLIIDASLKENMADSEVKKVVFTPQKQLLDIKKMKFVFNTHMSKYESFSDKKQWAEFLGRSLFVSL